MKQPTPSHHRVSQGSSTGTDLAMRHSRLHQAAGVLTFILDAHDGG